MEMNSMADWEEWVRLAREDPEKFERERAATIEELIMSQPAETRHRNRQLQWKINAIRQTSPNSLYACVRIYEMLMDSVYGPDGLLAAIELLRSRNGENDRLAKHYTPVKKKGLLLDFRTKRRMV
jgi:hypothetical protein